MPNTNDTRVPRDDPDGLDTNQIPLSCHECGISWCWHIDRPETMPCPSCRLIAEYTEED
jgi:hypothetical protein